MNQASDELELGETVMVIAPTHTTCDDLDVTGDDLEVMLVEASAERQRAALNSIPTTLIGLIRQQLMAARVRNEEAARKLLE
jgi:hypothetical protein